MGPATLIGAGSHSRSGAASGASAGVADGASPFTNLTEVLFTQCRSLCSVSFSPTCSFNEHPRDLSRRRKNAAKMRRCGPGAPGSRRRGSQRAGGRRSCRAPSPRRRRSNGQTPANRNPSQTSLSPSIAFSLVVAASPASGAVFSRRSAGAAREVPRRRRVLNVAESESRPLNPEKTDVGTARQMLDPPNRRWTQQTS